MPPINHVAVTAGIAAVSVAVAAAIAIYESEDVRRYTEQVRRRIAEALHNLGNELDPAQRRALEPLFNRPEDAQDFMMSERGGEGGIEADEETRKRQRDELMYWNAMRESNLEAEQQQTPAPRPRGASFDDFMTPDAAAGGGTFVVNTGADTTPSRSGLTRRNVAAGVAGLSAGLHADPFSDNHMMDMEDEDAALNQRLAPGPDEVSDIYSASSRGHNGRAHTPPSSSRREDALIDLQSADSASTASRTLDHEREDKSADEERSRAPPRGDRENLLAVIGAWADATEPDNGEESPSTPTSASFSHVGQMTPDELSLAGDEAVHVEANAGEAASEADVQ
ncbi:MAG: hypothetical protein IMZ46_17835, partial [Acidobacteria bacterium]|nr:hypothetical protein [Acidobacteriota bacterium]